MKEWVLCLQMEVSLPLTVDLGVLGLGAGV